MPHNRSASVKLLLLSMSVLAMTACSSKKTASSKADVPMPPVSEIDAPESYAAVPQPLSGSDTLTPVFPPAPVTAPPTPTLGVAEAPVAVVPVATTSATTDMESRIARLEQAVGSLRTDYDRIMPAFASLNTTNERIQTLLDEMERETGTRPVAASITPAPVVAAKQAPAASVTAPAAEAPTATAVVTSAPAQTTVVAAPAAAQPSKSGANVSALRVGEHGTKTRLVLDLTNSSKPDFKYDLDNGEKLLLVDLPSTGWAGAQSGNGGAVSPLVGSWNVQANDAGGSGLAIQLKKSARVLSTQFLPSGDGNPARLVIDIAPGA